MGGFLFNNKIIGSGGYPQSDQFGIFMTPINGPDGSTYPPGGAVLASLAVCAPLSSGSGAGYAAAIVLQRQGYPGGWLNQLDLIPGTGVDATATAGFPGLSGNTAIISYYVSGVFPNGAAFACVRNSVGVWSIQQQLVPGDGAPQQNYGFTCSIFGNIAVIASTVGDGPAIYVFLRTGTTWTQVQQFQPGDIGPSDDLAVAAMTANQLFLSANEQNTNTGAVYVYTLVGGQYQFTQKLVGASANDFFGVNVSCDGNTLVIGGGFSTTGKAYVYTKAGSAWAILQTLVGSDSLSGDRFGEGVAVSGTLMAVGAPIATVGGHAIAGAAYVFQLIAGVWTQTQKLTAPVPAANTYFGLSAGAIAGSPSWIAVGAPAIANAAVEGAAYFFYGPAIAPVADPFVTLTFKGQKVYA